MSELTAATQRWRQSSDYALMNVLKKWHERGGAGEPSPEFLREWLPYYLAQQWAFRYPDGGIY